MTLRGRLAAAVTTVVLAVALAACAPGAQAAPEPRPVTTEESQLLAAMRFRNYDAGVRALAFTVVDGAAELTFTGWYDFSRRTGYGTVDAADGARALLLWNGETIGLSETASRAGTAPLPVPADAEWSTSRLDPRSSRLHALVSVVAGLGADRPDNPLLLQQSGALWMGSETVGDAATTIFAGPPGEDPVDAGTEVDPDRSATRYWVDASGVLWRAEIRLGGDADWVRLEFATADAVDLGSLFGTDAG